MITIPERATKRLLQTNTSTILGDLWSTNNIDLLSNVAAIRLSPRLKLVTKTGDASATNLGVPVGFKIFDGKIFTVAGTRVFKNTGQDMNAAFAEDASTGASTSYSSTYSDIENFNDALMTTTDSKLYSKAYDGSGTGAWTDRTSSLNFSTVAVHMLKYFKRQDRVYITDYHNVYSISTTWVVAATGDYSLDINSFSVAAAGTPISRITSIEASSDKIWIGIIRQMTDDGSPTVILSGPPQFQASVLEWDGISATIVKEYIIPGASGVLSLKIQDDLPIIIDSNGILRKFTGQGFQEVARLPISSRGYLGFPTDIGNHKRFIHPNGMAVTQDGAIILNICNRNGYLYGSTESVIENLPSGIWEYTKEHGLIHRQSFSYLSVSSTSVTDYGQNRISKVGGIAVMKLFNISGIVNSLIVGCEYYTDASTTKDGIFVNASYPSNNATYPEGQKAGYFVSSWIFSQNIKDAWQKLFEKHKQLLDSSDKIVLKYRTREATPVEISITWVNTTSFTTATDVSALVGYEIEVLQGTGSGKCVHISSVSGSGPYTVTVDDTVTGVTTGTAKARYQNWKKAFTVQNQTDESTIKTLVNVNSERIQLKCYMEFTGDDEIFEVGIINDVNTELK